MKKKYYKRTREQLMRMYKSHKFHREHPERFGLSKMIRNLPETETSLTDQELSDNLKELFADHEQGPTMLYMSLHTQAYIQEMLERAEQANNKTRAEQELKERMTGQRRRQSRKKNRRNN